MELKYLETMSCILTVFVVIYFLNINLIACENSSLLTPIPTEQILTINLVQLEDWTIEEIIERSEEYYLKLCGGCQQKPDPSGLLGPQCLDCNCDEQCGLYGDCCDQKNENESLVEFQCVSYDTFQYLRSSMFMKVQCAENFQNETIKRACENPPECPSTPVTSDQGITYINEYCAQCNSETNFTKWNLTWTIPRRNEYFRNIADVYKCEFKIGVDSQTSKSIHKNTRECQINFEYEKCYVTGRPVNHNQDLEHLCQSSKPTEFQPVKKFGSLFKNIFCYFCNGFNFSEKSPTHKPYIGPRFMVSIEDGGNPFSGHTMDIVRFRLRYRRPPTKSKKIKKIESDYLPPPIQLVYNDTFFDPFQNRTMEILCNKGFDLKNGTCISDVAVHQVFIGVRLNTGGRSISHQNQALENVKIKLKDFQNLVAVIKHHGATAIDVKVIFILKNEELDVAQKAKDILYLDWLIDNDVISPEKVYVWNGVDFEQEPDFDPVYYVSDDITCQCLRGQSQKVSKSFEHYTEQYNCSYVEYDINDLQSSNSSDDSKQLGNLSLSPDEYTVSAQKIKICIKTIKEKYELSMIRHANSNSTSKWFLYSSSKWYWIWFQICLSISLGCLFFTLLTFSSFPSLRSLPCKNNMILIVFLIIGQLLLFTESHIGLKDLPCVFYGIAIHYAWLCVTFWMNTGSYHMFTVFRSSNVASNSTRTHWKILLKYALYANGVPIIIIASVVTASYFTSGTFGYGKNACYLDSSLLIIVAMVTPMTITIVFNLGFLSFTIWSISKTTQMAKDIGKDRHHIWVYIKLSTLTGLFWTVSILNNVFDSTVLSYIAVFLNYGQGFFIFLSYMVNRRVLNLWLGLCGKRLPKSTDSTSTKQTTKTKL